MEQNKGRANTIFALSSARGIGGVAVIRLSGCGAGKILDQLMRGQKRPQPRMASLRNLYDPFTQGDRKLDQAMVIYFEDPKSFTGEECVELHLHGGKIIIDQMLTALSQFPEARMAEPGEFTRRAFENGKLDLTEAEAIADLIHAETEMQQMSAMAQLDGALREKYEDWRGLLSKSLAYCEAAIDFPDEDLPGGLIEAIRPNIDQLIVEFKEQLGDNNRAQRIREGISIVLAGPPNAGKSSLLNKIADADVAIVTDLAGTTRDILDVRLNIGGYPVIMSDMAGLREKLSQSEEDDLQRHNAIEAEGIKRALKRAQNADYKIMVMDICDDYEARINQEPFKELMDDQTFLALNKADLKTEGQVTSGAYIVSAETGLGLPELLRAIKERLGADFKADDGRVLTRMRHREALQDALSCLQAAMDTKSEIEDELLAEELRLALRHLGRIVGAVDVEELLDRVFHDFCIGK